MFIKYVTYALTILITWKVLQTIYIRITVKDSSKINSIAVDMSLYVIDKILNDFMDDKRLLQIDIKHQDKVNYSYELSAIAFGYICRLSTYMLDKRQYKYLFSRLEKWSKARLKYRGTGSITYGYAVLALGYAKRFITKKYLMGSDGALILFDKYKYDAKLYEFFAELDREISNYIHENYEEMLALVSTIQEIRQEFNK